MIPTRYVEGLLMAKRRKKLVGQQLQEQPYDNVLKSLFEGQEAEMLPCFVPGVEYLEVLNVEALRTPLRADRVYKVRHQGQDKIAHFELETNANSRMTYRLLDYHAYFLRKYDGLPVVSIIVYPFRTNVAVSPLREMSGREEVLTFHFRVICLWELDAEDFISKRVVSMYPFLPTMHG